MNAILNGCPVEATRNIAHIGMLKFEQQRATGADDYRHERRAYPPTYGKVPKFYLY
jgi:hypothetical protein